MAVRRSPARKCYSFFSHAYLITLSVSGLIDGIAFTFTSKPDALAISFLTFLGGIVAVVHNILRYVNKPEDLPENFIITHDVHNNSTRLMFAPQTPAEIDNVIMPVLVSTENQDHATEARSWFCKPGVKWFRILNRVFMFVHAALVILSVVGAIELALTYRYTNPYVLPSRTHYDIY
jgi:hypothetical protein